MGVRRSGPGPPGEQLVYAYDVRDDEVADVFDGVRASRAGRAPSPMTLSQEEMRLLWRPVLLRVSPVLRRCQIGPRSDTRGRVSILQSEAKGSDRRGGTAMMMTEQVWEDERLRGTEKLVALGLAHLVDERGTAVVSLDDLGRRLLELATADRSELVDCHGASGP